MPYDIFHSYGLDKVRDSLTENYDYKIKATDEWKLVDSKEVPDSDGFITEYTWYTNGNKHIFMFGDSEIYAPDEDYADWVAETEAEAKEWFDSYKGFSDDSDAWAGFEEDDIDDAFRGNSNFMNDGFNTVYGNGTELED